MIYFCGKLEEIDKEINPSNLSDYEYIKKDYDIFQKSVIINMSVDGMEEFKLSVMHMLYINFIDTQIKLGKKLQRFYWWGKMPEHLKLKFPDGDREIIGWMAMYPKEKK